MSEALLIAVVMAWTVAAMFAGASIYKWGTKPTTNPWGSMVAWLRSQFSTRYAASGFLGVVVIGILVIWAMFFTPSCSEKAWEWALERALEENPSPSYDPAVDGENIYDRYYLVYMEDCLDRHDAPWN